MRMLRDAEPRDSDLEVPQYRGAIPKPRTRAPSDEATRARGPLVFDDAPTHLPSERLPRAPLIDDTPPHQHLTPSDDTRLVAPRAGRTPAPQRSAIPRPPTQPPPVPPRKPAGPPPSASPAPPPPAPPPLTLPADWQPPIVPQHPGRDATPTVQDTLERQRPKRPSLPEVAGFEPARGGLQPWMLVLGALIAAITAFVVTRVFIR